MNIRPLHDRVLVRRMEEDRKTASGIIIPDNATEKPDRGEVIAVGSGKAGNNGERIAPPVKVGDKVLFGKYAGTSVKIGGDVVLIMREDDLLAVID